MSDLVEAALWLEEGSMCVVEWNQETSTFQVVMIASQEGGPQDEESLIGHRAKVANDKELGNGIIALSGSDEDGNWYKLI